MSLVGKDILGVETVMQALSVFKVLRRSPGQLNKHKSQSREIPLAGRALLG
jgi:hypothetical protein